MQILDLQNDSHGLKFYGFSDSSSTIGWMHHSTFNPDTQPAHDEVTRTFSRELLQANSFIFSQHIPDESNDTANSLSRKFHLGDSQIYSAYGPQMPNNFTMLPPPDGLPFD